MANYCSNCAEALEFDARFCPACSSPVGVTAALTSEIRSGVQTRVQSIVHSPTLRVPRPIWAGVIEVFWTFIGIGLLLTSGIGAIAGTAGALAGRGPLGIIGAPRAAENLAVWLLFALLLFLIRLSFDLPLIYGFLTQRRWAYGLYLWSVGPLVLFGIVLRVATPSSQEVEATVPMSLTIISILGWILGIGLLVLQIILVLKSKDELVN